MIPFCYVFWKYGASIRAKCRYAADAERQIKAIMAMRQKQAEAAAKAKAEKAAGHDVEAARNIQTEVAGDVAENQVPAQAQAQGSAQTSAAEGRAQTGAAAQQGEEWDMYTVLADRDEVDLSDEERMRLQGLHERFDYARHPSKRST